MIPRAHALRRDPAPPCQVLEEETADKPSWGRNAKLGRFTNFVNLLDMCGIALPSGLVTYDAAQLSEVGGRAGGRLCFLLPLPPRPRPFAAAATAVLHMHGRSPTRICTRAPPRLPPTPHPRPCRVRPRRSASARRTSRRLGRPR